MEIEGWLIKKGGSFTVKWQKRYFRLKNNYIKYYKTNQENTQEQGSFSIDSVTIDIAPRSKYKREYVMEINAKSRVYVVQAENQENMLKWISTITKAVKMYVKDDSNNIPLSDNNNSSDQDDTNDVSDNDETIIIDSDDDVLIDDLNSTKEPSKQQEVRFNSLVTTDFNETANDDDGFLSDLDDTPQIHEDDIWIRFERSNLKKWRS